MGLLSTLDLLVVEGEVKDSQMAVEKLLDNEEKALERLEEISAIANQFERLNEAAKLIKESESLALLAKEMGDTANRAKKRMEAVKEKIISGIHDEVEKIATAPDEKTKPKVETKDFVFKVVKNPVTVVVDDLSIVPKKYRNEPKPFPPVDKWPVDKNAVKAALTKEKVESIKGVHLEESTRLDVKPR